MTYFQNLNRLILKELELRADHFVDLYDPAKPSVILVPGGMGSRLLQCQDAYREGDFQVNPAFGEIWLNWPAILFGKVGELGLDADELDHGLKPVIASGEMNSIVKSYDNTEAFFVREGFNYTEFGYDWRREIRSAAVYLKTFLEMIKTKAMNKTNDGTNPLKRLTLFAHSMGGLVVKLFIDDLLEDFEDPDQWFNCFVSVASPFYGTENHICRYYIGEKMINLLLGSTEKVAFMVASMPGPYGLMPAPVEVIEPAMDQLKLRRYPLRNAGEAESPVDPFGPEGQRRLPEYVDRTYIVRARGMFSRIANQLPNGLHDRIFHIRNNIRSSRRPVEWRWQPVDGLEFNAGDHCPIEANDGASDGTVPFWSARLAGTPEDHVLSLSIDTDHGVLAEEERVLTLVKDIAGECAVPLDSISTPAGEGPLGPLSSGIYDADITALIDEIRNGRSDESRIDNLPPAMRRALVNSLSLC